jgi:hypothetical protein
MVPLSKIGKKENHEKKTIFYRKKIEPKKSEWNPADKDIINSFGTKKNRQKLTVFYFGSS